ncbi:hypothetical protein ACFVRU_42840 [Streptomyces sp. NPDC057927]
MYTGVGTTARYYAQFNGSNGWHGDVRLPNHASQEGPAPAVFNNHLYCVHRGGSDKSLWWTRFNGTEDQIFCVHRSS